MKSISKCSALIVVGSIMSGALGCSGAGEGVPGEPGDPRGGGAVARGEGDGEGDGEGAKASPNAPGPAAKGTCNGLRVALPTVALRAHGADAQRLNGTTVKNADGVVFKVWGGADSINAASTTDVGTTLPGILVSALTKIEVDLTTLPCVARRVELDVHDYDHAALGSPEETRAWVTAAGVTLETVAVFPYDKPVSLSSRGANAPAPPLEAAFLFSAEAFLYGIRAF